MKKANKLFQQLFEKAGQLAIQKNWAQARSTLQEILDHEEAIEISPEFKLKITIHLADCCIQLGAFIEARIMLENPAIFNSNEAIEDISTRASYYLVYGHTISEFLGLEAADLNFEKALRLVESSNNVAQIESILNSMLYVGRSFQNWNYLLERATLSAEIASEKDLLELEIQATEFRAEACSHLGRTHEAMSLAKQILAHNRKLKNVDEYARWTQFIKEQEQKLPKKTLTEETTKASGTDPGIITIEELPQAGDSSTEHRRPDFAELAIETDFPDALSNNEALINEDFSPDTTSKEAAEYKLFDTKINNNYPSKKRRIISAELISIPPIYGLNQEIKSDNNFKVVASYILECYYFEIYKKGTVTNDEKSSLQKLFSILKLDRNEATKILHKALREVKESSGGQTDLDTFFEKIQNKILQVFPDSRGDDLVRKIAVVMNYTKFLNK